MNKENQYLAEKIISSIKNYKVIDEIVLSKPISYALEYNKENNITKRIDNNLFPTKDENKYDNVEKLNVLEIPKENNHKTSINNKFDLAFSDDNNDKATSKEMQINSLDKIKNNENLIAPKTFFNNDNSDLKNNQKGNSMNNTKQREFENGLYRDENIDSYDLESNSNVVSMVDLLSEDNINSIDNLNNIVNINDVYDDLGRNFQDDLIKQYSELDKSVSHTTNDLKYSYLPKRKIRDILFDKYNIKNEECVNELYSMAFNNKWKEIDVEHWLLNPTNIDNLISKCCEDDYIKPKLKKDEESDTKQMYKKNDKDFEFDNNQEKDVIEDKENSFDNNKFGQKIIPQNNIIEAKPVFQNQQHFPNIKDDLKSVLIEENYRKMQFDFQTEILKNHIDSKFRTFNDNGNNSSNIYDGNNRRMSDELIDSKITSFFNEKKSEILNEINDLKNKFSKNEKAIWDSLDYIRKEMKQNQNSLTNSLSNSLKAIKDEIETSLSTYINEVEKKQSNSLHKLLENFDNNSSLAPLKESFDEKFNILSDEISNLKEDLNERNNDLSNEFIDLSKDINQLKQNVNQRNNDLSNEFLDLRKEINDRVNTISIELSRNINDLYDEIDDINETIKKVDNVANKLSKENQTLNAKTNLFNNEISDGKKEIEKILENLNKAKDQFEDSVKSNDVRNSTQLENEKMPNYLDYLENDSSNFDNINNFSEQDMNYNNSNLDTKNVDFEYLKSSSNEFKDNEINDFDYDTSELTKKDVDFYKNFISDDSLNVNGSSKIVSNFDSKQVVSNLDIENNQEVIIEKKSEFDIKSKLSKIDEIIKNSINELNDIKEIVDDGEVRIDDSIKLFEKVK